jgi:hypothetical protein
MPDLTAQILWHLLGFLVVFEFLVYQARYLLNDVRDRELDNAPHLSKPRFPESWMKNKKDEDFGVKAAFVSFVARLVIALLIVTCLLPYKDGMMVWHLGFLASIFVIAELYETFRDKCNMANRKSRRTAWTVVLIAVVGLGYGLRAFVGLWLAGMHDNTALWLLAFGASLFGSTLIALTWALESTRGVVQVLGAKKAHLVLFRMAVSRDESVPVSTKDKVLADRQSLTAWPWSLPPVLATALLVAFALHAFGGVTLYQVVFIALGVACVAGVVVFWPFKTTRVWTGIVFVGSFGMFSYLSVPMGLSAVAALIATLPLIATCSFRSMRFDDLPGVTKKLIGIVKNAILVLYIRFAQKRRERKDDGHDPPSISPPVGKT